MGIYSVSGIRSGTFKKDVKICCNKWLLFWMRYNLIFWKKVFHSPCFWVLQFQDISSVCCLLNKYWSCLNSCRQDIDIICQYYYNVIPPFFQGAGCSAHCPPLLYRNQIFLRFGPKNRCLDLVYGFIHLLLLNVNPFINNPNGFNDAQCFLSILKWHDTDKFSSYLKLFIIHIYYGKSSIM